MLETGSYKEIQFAKEVCYVGDNETKVFVYNVDGLLIDCGPQSRAEQFRPWFREQNIKQVALTHNHEDHSGNARWIQDELKVPIYLHELAIPYAHAFLEQSSQGLAVVKRHPPRTGGIPILEDWRKAISSAWTERVYT